MNAWLRSHLAVIGFAILAAGNVAGWASLQAEQDARLEDVERDEAQRCVDQWTRTASTRDAIERAARIPSDALISVVAAEANGDLEDLLALYETLVDDGVTNARAEIYDPECDLDAAQQRLANQEEP